MSQAPSDRGSYPKGDERRARIVQTALEVFSERGYGAASMREIAAGAGLTQTGLLHHFRNKNELLLAVIELRDRQIDAALATLVDPTVRDRLLTIAEHNARERLLSTVYTVLVAEAGSPSHPAHDYFQERYTRQLGEVAGRLALGQAKGNVRPDITPEHTACVLIALLDGYLIQQDLVPGFDPAQALQEFWDSHLAPRS